MIKILDYILTKLEWRLSKKSKDKEKLILYRTLLNEIDNYKRKINPSLCILRHYRYATFKVDEIDIRSDVK